MLRQGDEVVGFTVLGTPGHLALWRESDRVLIGGDVFLNLPRLGPLAELRPALSLSGARDPAKLRAVL